MKAYPVITDRGAVFGTDAQRLEIASRLPKPELDKIWSYHPFMGNGYYPPRIEKMEDAGKWLASFFAGSPIEAPFVHPFIEHTDNQWIPNQKYKDAQFEIVIFIEKSK